QQADGGPLHPVIATAVVGLISIHARKPGQAMHNIVSLYEHRHYQEAARFNGQTRPIIRAMFAHPSPTPVKAALNMQGVSVGDVRLPMLPLTEEEKQTLKQILKIDIDQAS